MENVLTSTTHSDNAFEGDLDMDIVHIDLTLSVSQAVSRAMLSSTHSEDAFRDLVAAALADEFQCASRDVWSMARRRVDEVLDAR